MWSLISLLFRDRESVAAYQPLPLSDMYPSLETLSFETWANSAERGFGFWCRLPWALLGVNSSTAGAALTSGAFAESGCAARLPRSTLHLLGKKGGEKKKKSAFLTISCMRSYCSDRPRCNGASVVCTGAARWGRSLQELALWSLSSPTDDLTLSAFWQLNK